MTQNVASRVPPVRERAIVGFGPARARSNTSEDVEDAYAEEAPSPAELFLQIGVVLAVALSLAWILELVV